MRAAPPVQMACGHDARWQAGEVLLAASAAAAFAGWLMLQAGQGKVPALAAAGVAALLTGVFVQRRASRQSSRTLCWTGQAWTCDGRSGDLDLMIDFGLWVLLRFRPQPKAAAQWLPVSLDRCGAPLALCRAVIHAQAGTRTTTLATNFDANG